VIQRGRLRLVLFVGLLILVGAPHTAYAAISVTLAELNAGQLRLEGGGALSNRGITVNGTVLGTSDANGAFKLQTQPFSSPSCQVTVSDGASSALVTLSGCTPTAPGKPTFFVRTNTGRVGNALQFQAQGTNQVSSSLAFLFTWGDGTSLRDPATGFYTVDPASRVSTGFPVTHTWRTAGTFSVTITGLDPSGSSTVSDPITVTIQSPPQQNDCGTGADAGNTVATATLITLPVACTGILDPANLDTVDVYKFTVTQPFRLLTVTLGPASMFNLGNGEINLIDPTGTPRGAAMPGFAATRGDLMFLSLCPAPNVHCNTPPTPPATFGFGYTLDMTGDWKLLLGGDFTKGGTYTMSLHTGGGGDDCVQGRAPTLTVPPPVDAPNQGTALRLLDVTETNCAGSLPFADLDFHDAYVFPVVQGEPIVVSVASTEGLNPCSGSLLAGLAGAVPREAGFAGAICIGDTLGQVNLGVGTPPGTTSTIGMDISPRWTSTADLRGYQLRVATGSHHNGDCFTGADAGNTFATATAMPVAACIGDIALAAGDTDDWYSFNVAVGQRISARTVTPNGATLPTELYDPNGTLRQGLPQNTSFIADLAGAWRLRVATTVPNVAPYTGTYGFQVLRTAPFTGVTLNPSTVVGGNAVQATISLATVTTDGVPVMAINSSSPGVAVPSTPPTGLVIPPGSSSVTIPVNTSPVTATTQVTISASISEPGGIVTKTALLTVQAPPAPPAPADSVAVTLAEYDLAKQILNVQATSTSANATLTLSVTSTGQAIGTLTNAGGGSYQGQFAWPSNPQNITVSSTLGGSGSLAVTPK
jgi:PKD domain-containing protein